MKIIDWQKEFQCAITICDTDGVIIYMNDKAAKDFEKDGGQDLIGTNVLDCHPEPSKSQLKDMLLNQKTNIYTIEKNGIRKLIYQSPIYESNIYIGLIEISFEIPFEMEHFVRK
ncbi:MAG: PAS domain-containing protein [Bacteroidetes bacterium]|nr:PAS domain-containing protein [Bacteroidota bacterium]MBU2586423.1 PAS domain-containing protein [Bacteroidota bacterium]